jgi:hypothetical protein
MTYIQSGSSDEVIDYYLRSLSLEENPRIREKIEIISTPDNSQAESSSGSSLTGNALDPKIA